MVQHQIPNRQSIRLPNYDYSQQGLYFITVCTQNREYLFGDIVNAKMNLNPVGEMVDRWWNEIPNKYPGVKLDICQTMPNHIHMIINIVSDGSVRGSTHGSTPTKKYNNDNNVGADPCVRPYPTVGTIIQWFKTMTTNEYINHVKTNHWEPFSKRIFQRNYYEHIVRNDVELFKIREYIENNPQTWENDRNNLEFGISN